jgi:hypothetical protein
MSDNWEDWEDAEVDNLIAPLKEELHRLEERKLVEESDNALSKELFETDNDNKLTRGINPNANLEKNIKLENEKVKAKVSDKDKEKIKMNKQKENEQKQKEFSKKNKEQKNKQKRHNELYGEVEGEYIYDDYGDKFYN